MSKVLEVQVSDEYYAWLEHMARASERSATEIAENVLSSALSEKIAQSAPFKEVDFDAALMYALNKNEELLHRLAK